MPQKRVQIPSVGIWPALCASILPLAKKYPVEAANLVTAAGPRTRTTETYVPTRSVTTGPVPSVEILADMLSSLTFIAVEPKGDITRRCIPPAFLLECYTLAPDLTLAVLQKARAVWFKQSKAQRVCRLLAANRGIKPLPHQPARSVWELDDKEIQTAFEGHFSGETPLTVDDVEKARKKLTRDIRAGERLLANW